MSRDRDPLQIPTSDECGEWVARFRLDASFGIGPRIQKRLYEKFGSAVAVFGASPDELSRIEGMGGARIAVITKNRCTLSTMPRDSSQRSGAILVGFPDPVYPALLREIDDPPPFFWTKGDITTLSMPCVAIVGTRRASAYGRRTAHRLAFELASAGLCIVSGLAYGIDRAAHEGALDARGSTVAVLGSGIDQIYPREHRALARKIEESGCIVTEFPPGTPPDATNFPLRNRVISGMCGATVVVEAFEKAGALITASLCNEQGRELYVVPGRIDEATSCGTNALLAQTSAHLLSSSRQIVQEYEARGWLGGREDADRPEPVAAVLPRARLETAILDVLGRSEMQINDLEEALDFPGGGLWTALLLLECDGLIKALPGNRYESAQAGPKKKESTSSPPDDALS